MFKWQVLKTESKDYTDYLTGNQVFTLDDLYTPIYSKAITLQVPNFILIHIEIFTIKTYTYFQGTFCLSVLEIFFPES